MEMESVKPDDIDLSYQNQEAKLIVKFEGLPSIYANNPDSFSKIIQLFTGADDIKLKFEDFCIDE